MSQGFVSPRIPLELLVVPVLETGNWPVGPGRLQVSEWTEPPGLPKGGQRRFLEMTLLGACAHPRVSAWAPKEGAGSWPGEQVVAGARGEQRVSCRVVRSKVRVLVWGAGSLWGGYCLDGGAPHALPPPPHLPYPLAVHKTSPSPRPPPSW